MTVFAVGSMIEVPDDILYHPTFSYDPVLITARDHPLARQAKVSPASVSQVLTELERFDWLEARGQGPAKERHVRDPRGLLDAWVKQLPSLRPPAMRRYYVPSVRSEALIEKLGHVFAARDVDYAMTHEAAAQRYAPFRLRPHSFPRM